MSDSSRRERIHNLDVTVWVGKRGVEAVVEELSDQLDERDLVKVKFHRSARANADAAGLATELANRVGGSVVETRGHTAVLEQ